MGGIGPRATQTKVKHTIVEKYLKSWGGIILNGLRGQGKAIHFVYIDCNASYGRYHGELEDHVARRDPQTIWGSPIIGVRVLDELAAWAREVAHMHVQTNAILFEKETKIFEDLKTSLQLAGLASRVRETDDFALLHDQEIALLHLDSTTMAAPLIRYTRSTFKFSFLVLDPYGPKGIPLPFVHEMIRQPRHDVLIYMPFFDLQKKSGLVPKQHRSSVDEKLLDNYDRMFGHQHWREIVKAMDNDEIRRGQASLALVESPAGTALQAKQLELDLMNCYKQSLRAADSDLVVKSLDLHFPDRERTIYYLYLTTHDPTGALRMNKVLDEAGYLEYELRWKFMQAKKQPGQLLLFEMAAPPLPEPSRASIEQIGEYILRLLGGKSVTKREIYAALVEEPYFPEEVDKALKDLRRQKKVFFDGELRNRTIIRIARV